MKHDMKKRFSASAARLSPMTWCTAPPGTPRSASLAASLALPPSSLPLPLSGARTTTVDMRIGSARGLSGAS